MLRLDIHLPTGVFRATSVADRGRSEWPPHPDRIFSALVCAWAENGAEEAGRAALSWLESLDPPALEVSSAGPRDVCTVYVPPNDRSDGRRELGLSAKLQPRTFPAVVPNEPRVRLWWRASEEEVGFHLPTLDRIARQVGYLGHSASLVSMRFLPETRDPAPRLVPAPDGLVRLRVPYPGRLEELVNGFEAGKDRGFRPEPAPAVSYRDLWHGQGPEAFAGTAYGRNWIVLAGTGRRSPALEAFVRVAEAMRGALLADARKPVPPVLSGHEGNGPAATPHLAVLPLANVGFDWSDGRLFGLALVLPRDHDGLADPIRIELEEAVARFLASGGTLSLGRFGTWCLEHDPAPERASLRSARYLRAARRFASVTPIVLPRHMKARRGDTAEAQIAFACGQQGLPEPDAVEVGPRPFLAGTSLARRRPGGTGPAQPNGRGFRGWIVSERLGTRSLVHARIRFAAPVRGPLLLGAGRHFGLGLLLPVD